MAMMDLDRFAALVDAYGGAPARWPESEREAAMELLKTSPEARRLAEEADALDRLLDTPETAPATRVLQDRILASLATAESGRTARMRTASIRWFPAAAFACSLLLGVGIGTQAPRLAGLDDETLAQEAASRAMTVSTEDGDIWLGAYE